jgi:hypothetical protein
MIQKSKSFTARWPSLWSSATIGVLVCWLPHAYNTKQKHSLSRKEIIKIAMKFIRYESDGSAVGTRGAYVEAWAPASLCHVLSSSMQRKHKDLFGAQSKDRFFSSLKSFPSKSSSSPLSKLREKQ